FSPDGAILAAGGGSAVQLWRIDDGTFLRRLRGHTSVQDVAFTPDDATVMTADPGVSGPEHISPATTVRRWRLEDGFRIATLTAEASAPRQVAFAAGGTALATQLESGLVKLWRVTSKGL